MVAAIFTPKRYLESIQILSDTISFLQQNPSLNIPGQDIVTLEPITTSMQELSNIWSILGGHYYPSVLCKARMISFDGKEIKDINILFQLTSAFYSEADKYRSTVEKIIETVHYHTFAVELAAKLLENGISTPGQLLAKLQEERASLDNEDKIKIIKDGQSSKATYYSHIHTLFSLYALSRKQQDIMCNLCFLPYTGISARIFAKWLELPTLNEINDLIETGFVQTTTRHTISLHPMIKEIALSETKPSVSSCHILLDSLQKICLMHGIEVDYYKKLFQTAGNIIELIEKDLSLIHI